MDAQHEGTSPYGIDAALAVDLVEAGYRAILGEFNAAKQRGVISTGRLLSEMITSPSWTPPPLLTSEKLVEYRRLTGQHEPYDILAMLWYVVEHVCGETRLVPSIKIDRATGHLVVMLSH